MNNQEMMMRSPALGGQQMASGQDDWRLTLPQDWTVAVRGEDGLQREIPLREHPTLGRYASKDEAVKALVHAQRLIGRRPEPMGQYAAAPPEGPDAYGLPDLDLPDGFELDDDLRTAFRAKAFELGISPEQARGLYEWFLPRNIAAWQGKMDEDRLNDEREMETLRAVHRGESEGVLESARQAAMALGGEELSMALEETGAGRRAVVLSALARMAPMLTEGRLRSSGAGPGRMLGEEQLTEMMRDPRYHDPTQRDPAFVRRIEQGFERLYPGSYQPGNRV
ncbi:MAG: hypothetical protein AB7D51_00370 [Desulfovibrionaceae bacterium]